MYNVVYQLAPRLFIKCCTQKKPRARRQAYHLENHHFIQFFCLLQPLQRCLWYSINKTGKPRGCRRQSSPNRFSSPSQTTLADHRTNRYQEFFLDYSLPLLVISACLSSDASFSICPPSVPFYTHSYLMKGVHRSKILCPFGLTNMYTTYHIGYEPFK